MPKTVLIVIDNSKRELSGCLLLARYLTSLKIKPIICSIFALHYYYLRYRPAVVVMPNLCYNLAKIAEGSRVVIMSSESGNGQKDLIQAFFSGTEINPVYPEFVERSFCWGQLTKEALLETGKWRQEQLMVTGSPFTDHWFLPPPAVPPKELRIGITTTFRALSNSSSPRKVNYFQWIDEAELYGGDGTYYEPPQHIESWFFFEASLARCIIGLIRSLVSQRKEIIDIRPHPLENKVRYRYLKNIGNGKVYIDKESSITEWLENKFILFTCNSGSALDALARGVPVVSLKGLLDPHALGGIPKVFPYPFEDMLWQVKDISDIYRYLDLATKGELPPSRDKKKSEEFLKNVFHFPRKYLAAQLIAIEIKKIIEESGNTVRNYNAPQYIPRYRPEGRFKQYLRKLMRYRFFQRVGGYLLVPPLVYLVLFTRYIYGLLPGNRDIGFSFYPWRIRQIRRAKKIVNKLEPLFKEKDARSAV